MKFTNPFLRKNLEYLLELVILILFFIISIAHPEKYHISIPIIFGVLIIMNIIVIYLNE